MSDLKQLTHEVFERDDCPKWAKSAAVDSDGVACYYAVDKSKLSTGKKVWEAPMEYGGFFPAVKRVGFSKFDSTNWKKSAINREQIQTQ